MGQGPLGVPFGFTPPEFPRPSPHGGGDGIRHGRCPSPVRILSPPHGPLALSPDPLLAVSWPTPLRVHHGPHLPASPPHPSMLPFARASRALYPPSLPAPSLHALCAYIMRPLSSMPPAPSLHASPFLLPIAVCRRACACVVVVVAVVLGLRA